MRAHRLRKQVVLGGEVLVHLHRGAEAHDGDQIRRRHLLVDKVQRALAGAIELVGLHVGQVEEQHDQAAVANARRFCCSPAIAALARTVGAGEQVGRRRALRLHLGRSALREALDILEIERPQLLRLAVFEHREIALLQIANEVAMLVAHAHVHQHQVAVDAYAVSVRGFHLPRRALRESAEREPDTQPSAEHGDYSFPRPWQAHRGWQHAALKMTDHFLYLKAEARQE